MRASLLVFLFSLMASLSLSGQQTDVTAPTLHVQSQIVVLDTVVTDRDGKVVTGLTKDDFTVYENGVPQSIRHFSSSHEQPAVPTAAVKDRNGHEDWGSAPLTILVVDEMDTPFTELAYARDCTRNYLKAQPEQLATPTILLWLNDGGLRALTSFTRDRQVVLNALNKQPPSLPSKLMRGAAAEQVAAAFAALQQAALFSRGEPGRKELIWVGRSFPSVDPINLDDYSRTLLTKAVRSTADLLLASRVTLYVIDPTVTGSARDDDQAQEVDTLQLETASTVKDPFASSFNINLFVNETGGKYFRGRNDLEQQIADSERRGLSYYTLTYVPTETMEAGAYRKITVRLRNPNLIAQTKKGYYTDAPPPAAPSKLEAKLDVSELRFDLYEAAVTGMQYTGLGAHLDGCVRDVGKPSSTCTVVVDTGSLTFAQSEAGDERTTLMTVVASLDAKGRLVNDTVARLTLAIPEAQATAIATGASRLRLHTVVPEGTVSVRAIVRDASGRIGTADLAAAEVKPLVAADLSPKAVRRRP